MLPWRHRHNPLCRRTDRLQGWIALGLLLTVPLLGLLAAFAAGDAAGRHYRATAERQAHTRHHSTAVLLRDAPRHPEPGSDEARRTRYPVEVRFTDPHGRPRTGMTDVPPGTPADTAVRVWVGADGTLTGPPLTGEEIHSRAMGWAVLASLAVALLGLAAHGTAAAVLRRRQPRGVGRPLGGDGPPVDGVTVTAPPRGRPTRPPARS
ncbi:Rv1733c family protein [Streptomyces fumanus]|uniref:Rv1733c family protein n=1 Tax=Streptomyces fumanus TaxID=67302 RepID=UPI0033C842FB